MVEEIFEESVEEPKRKLASIQIISDLQSIEGADKIEVATVEGWKVVVQKGLYEVGDKCIYFEIDSVLPLDKFPELQKCGGRIKTIKLRGQISQGYCIPVSEHFIENIPEGSDVTDILAVTKYTPKSNESNSMRLGNTAGNFPTHLISKTDEERIQSNLKYLQEIFYQSYEITVKCDGSSCTVGMDNGEFFLASRNLKKKYEPEYCTFAKAAEKYDLKRKFETTELARYILQGEVCGPGIQGNKLGLKEVDYFVFNVFDTVTKKMVKRWEQKLLSEKYGFCMVPLVEIGPYFNYTLDKLIELAKGKYEGTDNHREGIVIRSYSDKFKNEYGGYISFKCINNDFLLKEY